MRLKELTSFFLQLRQELILLMEGQLLQPRLISRVLPLRLERTVPLPEPRVVVDHHHQTRLYPQLRLKLETMWPSFSD